MMILEVLQQKTISVPGYPILIPTDHQFLPLFVEFQGNFQASLNTKGQSDSRRKPMKPGQEMSKQRHQEETETNKKKKGTEKHFLKISD